MWKGKSEKKPFKGKRPPIPVGAKSGTQHFTVRCSFSHQGQEIIKNVSVQGFQGASRSVTERAILKTARAKIVDKRLFARYGMWSLNSLGSVKMEII